MVLDPLSIDYGTSWLDTRDVNELVTEMIISYWFYSLTPSN